MKRSVANLLLAGNLVAFSALFLEVGCGGSSSNGNAGPGVSSQYVVFGYNDLGMHCINQDFSELCVLPPANNLRAQVIRRGDDPQILTGGIQVLYSIPGNTQSALKTNFWQYAGALFGAAPALNVGLFGFGMSGAMQPTTANDFMARGIPLTQVTDAGATDWYQLARIEVQQNGKSLASTQTVIPVSWEMSCDRCHTTPGTSVAANILAAHDRLHGTQLVNQKPVLCASCHADPALGTAGVSGALPLSTAMHTAHANRMSGYSGTDLCYSCHPGPQTQCLRDVHEAKGLTCQSCHVSMQAVGDSSRRPWQDEPRCGTCHSVAGHEYEQTGVLYRDSVGHNGVKCIACHGSPHAITPSMNPRDNVQAIALQGSSGAISKCTVCHSQTPGDAFNHTRGGG